MLTKIDIKNFRSCLDVRLENIKDILILIGRNGAGKTNILKAVDWACQFAIADIESLNKRKNTRIESGNVGVTFSISQVSYRYEIKQTVNYIFTEKKSREQVVSLEERLFDCNGIHSNLIFQRRDEHLELFDPQTRATSTVEISKSVPSLSALSALYPEENYFRRIADSTRKFFSGIRYYPLHNFDENFSDTLIMGSDYQNWTADRTQEPNSILSALYKIVDLYLEDNDTFEELSILMGSRGLGLLNRIDIQEIKLGETGSTEAKGQNSIFFVYFIYGSSKTERRFSFNELSFGTKRILFLLIAMLYDKSSVALLEQPEDGVHTALVTKLIDLFRAYSHNSQFIIASHSTTILNKAKPKEVYFISNTDNWTSARSLTPDETRAAERFLKRDGPLSEFLDLLGDD